MRSATRFALAAFAFVLWSGSAAAQNDVTFQVDMNAYIATCQFNAATNTVRTPGDMNGWDNAQFPLTDANADGIYTGTYSLPAGPINYKHYVGGSTILSWENDPNRTLTVVAGPQTVNSGAFNGPAPVNACGATSAAYDLLFQVDMSIQRGRGAFNPAAGDVVAAVGEFQGWDTANPFILTEDSFTPGLYTGVTTRTVGVPSATGFKFIIKKADATITWDSVNPAVTPDNSGGSDPNRLVRIVGGEPDTDANGNPNWTYDNDGNATTAPFFQDAGADRFLTGPATVTFTVDMRSAQYRILDSGALPAGDGSPVGGNTSIPSVFINGPAAGESNQDGGPAGGIGDWAAWGAVLAAQPTRQLAGPDANSRYSLTLNYSAGAYRSLVAKFGVNGADDEAGFGVNHVFPITEGANSFNLSFGCVLRANGSYTDDYTIGTILNPYDAYLLINNVVQPETCTVVRSGGEGDVLVGIENGPSIAGVEISAAYPNPVRSAGRIDLTLDRAMTVAVRVYDVTGRQVATLVDGRQVAAGTTTLDIDTARLAAGVYVLRVEADGQVATRRMTVTR